MAATPPALGSEPSPEPLAARGGRLTAIFLGLVAVGLALGATWSYFQVPEEGPMTGREAPGFSVELVDGSTFTLDNLLAGEEPAVLTLWASWCASCAQQARELEALTATRPGVAVLAVAVGDTAGDAAAHWAGPASVRVGVDPERSLAGAYEASGVPVTYVIGPDGRVLHHLNGVMRSATLERMLGED